jgi:flagellin-like protein
MKRKMNTRSRKALSPVVASIILIAVTVAVSIAVAAWMGALSFNFMATEQGQVTNLQFNPTANTITVTFQNTGTTPITIKEVWVNNQLATGLWTISNTIGDNSQDTCTITPPTGITITAGNQYEVKLVSAKGNAFPRTGTAPV